jgi:hypothetical protein
MNPTIKSNIVHGITVLNDPNAIFLNDNIGIGLFISIFFVFSILEFIIIFNK